MNVSVEPPKNLTPSSCDLARYKMKFAERKNRLVPLSGFFVSKISIGPGRRALANNRKRGGVSDARQQDSDISTLY